MNRTRYLEHFLSLYKRSNFTDNLPTLEILKDEYIRYLLELTAFDILETARILDISPEILRKRLNRLEIGNQSFRQ